ncbi:hypothetical protein [Mycobacterium sp. 155]|uniref:hypothetical protein n=1 Tax=Mycobacterium sp. 155 TaxID=1157943 RepID=UPI0003795C0F|nr:hypothetical protein [Mycobacterium sp. 155]
MTWNRNSGYVGNRMSVRATAAYDDGALPLSKITTAWVREHGIDCTRAALLDLVTEGVVGTGEWHHTGGFFAETGFYRPEQLREQVAALTSEQIAAARRAAKARRESEKAGTVHRNCTVEWLEWFGKRIAPDEHRAEGATVTVRGETATITLTDGTTFTKRVSTDGFRFESATDRRQREMQEKQARRRREAQERDTRRAAREFYADIDRRLRAVAAGKRIEFLANSNTGEWKRVNRSQVAAWLREGYGDIAARAVSDLESGRTEVFLFNYRRIRLVSTTKTQAVAA